MSNITSKTKRVAVVTGLFLGAFALAALADWTAPTQAPPNCTSGNPGCDAPINVGGTTQTKTGSLTIGGNMAVTNLLGAAHMDLGGVATHIPNDHGGGLDIMDMFLGGTIWIPISHASVGSCLAANGTQQDGLIALNWAACSGGGSSGGSSGVSSITAGTGIAASGSTGNVTISMSGGSISEYGPYGLAMPPANFGPHTFCSLSAGHNNDSAAEQTWHLYKDTLGNWTLSITGTWGINVLDVTCLDLGPK